MALSSMYTRKEDEEKERCPSRKNINYRCAVECGMAYGQMKSVTV